MIASAEHRAIEGHAHLGMGGGPKVHGQVCWQSGTLFDLPWQTPEHLKPILHYVFGLRFGNVCDQKREKNGRKTGENANGFRF